MIITIALDTSISAASWDAVIEAVHDCTPLLVVVRHSILHAGTDNIDVIRQHVRRWTARAAMAPDRTSSLLCALEAVPGRIDAHASADHVSCSVLGEFPSLGVDDIMLQRLRLFGCSTIGTLLELSERHLRAQFGDVGRRLYNFLHTTSSTLPLYQPPERIRVVRTFEDPASEPGLLLDVITQLCTEAYNSLAGREAWRIDLGVLDRSGDVSARRGRIMRTAITTLRELHTHAQALLHQLLSAARRWWGMYIQLSSLRHAQYEQTELFRPQTSPDDLRLLLTPKYGDVIKHVDIINPWSVIPEDYARIIGYRP